MKRLYVVVLFVLGFTAAGAFSGAVIADVTTSSSTTTTGSTTTNAATTTTTTATTTTTTTTAPAPNTIPAGVRVAGVRVGGLRASDAVAAVHDAFARPLAVVVNRSRLSLDPVKFTSVYIQTAVARARVAPSGTNVDLVVSVRGAPLRVWVASVQKRFTRAPVDATLKLWDYAAVEPIVTEAGGRFEPLGRQWLSSNGLLHEAAVAALA